MSVQEVAPNADLDRLLAGAQFVDAYRILVPRHGDYDWLILSQSRMGISFGATRISMLRATPG